MITQTVSRAHVLRCQMKLQIVDLKQASPCFYDRRSHFVSLSIALPHAVVSYACFLPAKFQFPGQIDNHQFGVLIGLESFVVFIVQINHVIISSKSRKTQLVFKITYLFFRIFYRNFTKNFRILSTKNIKCYLLLLLHVNFAISTDIIIIARTNELAMNNKTLSRSDC